MNLRKEVENIVKEAADMMLHVKYTKIMEKGDAANIVTDMDVKIQQFLVERLTTLLPGSSVLAEENDLHELKDGYQWIIDPIDGTMNYAYDYHHSAISVALIKDREGMIGVCLDPYLKECFSAETGKGAYRNDQRIHVTSSTLSNGLVMCGTSPYHKEWADLSFGILKELFLRSRDIRRSGSAVLDICYVAAGRCDCFYEEELACWDHAAAVVILKEAGGVVEALHGDYGYKKNIGILAGNKEIVKELHDIVYHAYDTHRKEVG